jgi:serine/threonine-protein kinase HipA
MTISERPTSERPCFVWIWLPTETAPVVAGKLTHTQGRTLFTYGQSYLERRNAIALYDQELPLRAGTQESGTEELPGCLRDSAPDAWGRRVILNKLLGLKGSNSDTATLDEITYLLESGSDRIGALDFQASAAVYVPRLSAGATLEELLHSATRVEQGIPLTAELDQALHHGSSIGGARPKTLIDGDGKKYIAKFSSTTDIYNVIKAEFVAMRLAARCGLDVAPVALTRAAGKDVLLIERFDRVTKGGIWHRRLILSALTLLGLQEMTARYASYQDFAEIIRHRFTSPRETLRELFSRLVFNILCSNTDDHARNHAAFWDGKTLHLTPAYDICPQLRTGGEATQAMSINGMDKSSRLVTCLQAAEHFMLTKQEAAQVIAQVRGGIDQHLLEVCREAELTPVEQQLFCERLFNNPYAFEGYQDVLR